MEHRAQVAPLLLLGAVGDDRRAEHADADDVEDAGHARARDLLADDDLLDGAETLAADVDRPGDAGQAALGELALPAPAGVDVGVLLGCMLGGTTPQPGRPGSIPEGRPAAASRSLSVHQREGHRLAEGQRATLGEAGCEAVVPEP